MNQTKETILIIDDDIVLTEVLARALKKRDYVVVCANNHDSAIQQVKSAKPQKIILDLRIGDESGLSLIPKLINACKDTCIVILTGYSSIATAVEAIKLGAFNYLCKPADAEQILSAFNSQQTDSKISTSESPLSVKRLTWEHIQKVLADNNGNISATARALGMHRRTLQRKLQKRPSSR